ncbi:nuclease (SNase domain protein) [Hirschia baltica ATCC 49814]|uniref:Nuclease (SNase domain protein) n=2 Tax=Hirschia TaxID=2723 RepID=C6XPH7_HIRBI|nr:nuclease (SNase domain protein) [Hirschia baltica ATCC 49814]
MNVSKYINMLLANEENLSSNSFNRRVFLAASGSSIMLSGCGGKAEPTDKLIAGEVGIVSRIRDGDAFTLDTGLSVRLAGIEAPRRAWNDRPADPFGEEATKLLNFEAVGRKCQLFYGGLTRDRYDRAIAHAFVEDEAGQTVWLNKKMIELGGARVRTWADNVAHVRQLYDHERDARNSNIGLWAHSEYDVFSPNALKDAPRGLALVQGKVSKISEVLEVDSRCSVGEDGLLHLTMGLTLARSTERIDLAVGQEIRVRSSIRREKNPDGKYEGEAYLAPDHWGQFEIVL